MLSVVHNYIYRIITCLWYLFGNSSGSVLNCSLFWFELPHPIQVTSDCQAPVNIRFTTQFKISSEWSKSPLWFMLRPFGNFSVFSFESNWQKNSWTSCCKWPLKLGICSFTAFYSGFHGQFNIQSGTKKPDLLWTSEPLSENSRHFSIGSIRFWTEKPDNSNIYRNISQRILVNKSIVFRISLQHYTVA